ncbi:MAG: hypothetical protein FWE71_10560 [Nocardioidaceae bacterium]|nr:hypothetical protein [Nocardioidaceae bacterium]MCL2612856.1 hypothetical protein [Nocardioidaceae bacterium]
MNRPVVRRLRSALVALALTAAGTGTAVAVGPAHAAAATCTDSLTLTANGRSTGVSVAYGTYVSVHVDVVAHCTGGSLAPGAPLGGTTTLWRSFDAGDTWTKAKTASSADRGHVSIHGTHVVRRTTWFYASYSGGTDSSGDTFAAAPSRSVGVGIYRTTRMVSYRSIRGGTRSTYKVGPAASIRGLEVVFQRRAGSRWRADKKIRAGSAGIVVGTFAIGRYRMHLPAARGMLGSYATFSVTRHRPAHDRVALR